MKIQEDKSELKGGGSRTSDFHYANYAVIQFEVWNFVTS